VSVKYNGLARCAWRPLNFINFVTWNFFLKVMACIQPSSTQEGLPYNWFHVQLWNRALSKPLRCIFERDVCFTLQLVEERLTYSFVYIVTVNLFPFESSLGDVCFHKHRYQKTLEECQVMFSSTLQVEMLKERITQVLNLSTEGSWSVDEVTRSFSWGGYSHII
jgi:hypothetical protein